MPSSTLAHLAPTLTCACPSSCPYPCLPPLPHLHQPLQGPPRGSGDPGSGGPLARADGTPPLAPPSLHSCPGEPGGPACSWFSILICAVCSVTPVCASPSPLCFSSRPVTPQRGPLGPQRPGGVRPVSAAARQPERAPASSSCLQAHLSPRERAGRLRHLLSQQQQQLGLLQGQRQQPHAQVTPPRARLVMHLHPAPRLRGWGPADSGCATSSSSFPQSLSSCPREGKVTPGCTLWDSLSQRQGLT